MNDLCFSFYLWSQVNFHRHFIGNQESSNIGETQNKTTNEPTPVHVAIKQKGATMFNVKLRLGISVIAVIGTVMYHDGFSPLYTPEIHGIGMSNEAAVQVYIPPPSTEASCGILCSLTPGCVWAKFDIYTRRCALSHSVCPRPTESQESYLVAVVADMVHMVLLFYVNSNHFPSYTSKLLQLTLTAGHGSLSVISVHSVHTIIHCPIPLTHACYCNYCVYLFQTLPNRQFIIVLSSCPLYLDHYVLSGNMGLWGCHYDPQQRWIYDAKTGQISSVIRPGDCWDVDGKTQAKLNKLFFKNKCHIRFT